MRHLIYFAMMAFWVVNFQSRDPFMALVCGYFTYQFYKTPQDVVAAPTLTLVKSGSCNCTAHRIFGRIKMAA